MFVDDREGRLVEREQAVSTARAALRAEREQLAADRAEADRLLAEARTAHREATRARDRARRLGGRFAQRLKHEHAGACRLLEEREGKLATDRARLAAEVARFETIRSEFHATAAAARDRLRDAWAGVKAQQKRAAREWARANRHFTEQTALLNVRTAEVVQREKTLKDDRVRIEAETAGLREEATALETRIQNARTSLAELELRRDRARAELLDTELPIELMTDVANLDDLARREHVLAREKTALAAIKTSLDQEAADVNDRRRVLAEQVVQLAGARAKWQQAERQTVLEMEELARELGRREHELDGREQRLIRADVRRRDEAYELWRLQLRLEAWQSKLTVVEMRWHSERERLESDLATRTAANVRREAELEEAFGWWEKARAGERERLRGELELWAADRERLAKAAADLDKQRHAMLGELTQHAARALAAEQLVIGEGNGSGRGGRRLAVLRKRWERTLARKAREIEHLGSEVAAERATIEDRHRALQAFLNEVVEREAALNNRQAAADLHRVTSDPRELKTDAGVRPAGSPSSELVSLRAEVDRLGLVLLDLELPGPPDPPASDLPWAVDEPEGGSREVLRFDRSAWAA